MSNERELPIHISIGELSELIGQIYDAALNQDWSDVLDRMIDVTASNKAFFFLNDLTNTSPLILEFRMDLDYSAALLKSYTQRLDEDPFYQFTEGMTEGETLVASEHVNIEQLRTTAFYHDILVPFKSHHVLAGIALRDGNHDACYAINRGPDDPKYCAEDINLAQLLTPHFSRGAKTFRTLKLHKSYTALSRSVIDQTSKAIMIVNRSRQVILSNAFAQERLGAHCFVAMMQKKILIADRMTQRKLDRYIEHCCTLAYQEIGTHETLLWESPKEGLILISVSPLSDTEGTNDFDQPCCMVTVAFENVVDWSSFTNKFSLTQKELSLMRGLTRRRRLNDMATETGVSYNTLRTHLQSVFRKVGVSSQNELMAVVNMFR